MKIQYRKATPGDVQRVWYVVRYTKDVIYPDYYTQAVVEYVDRYYTFEIIKNDIEQGRTRVLVKDGEIIATGSRVDNHIMRVYVLPEFQGQGFGSALVTALCGMLAPHFDHIRLGFVSTNPQSRHFWLKNGFHIVSEGEYIVIESYL